MAKKLILGLILVRWAQIRVANFFFKNLPSSVTRYYGQLSSSTTAKKTNDSILRKFKAGRTNRRTDGHTDRRTRVIS